MSLKNKLTKLAKSDKGKELIDKAQAFANDPKNRERIETARGKVEHSLDAAKHKLAEKRGEKDAETTAPVSTEAAPDPAAEAAVDAAAETTTPPDPPAYGGDDGPKAA